MPKLLRGGVLDNSNATIISNLEKDSFLNASFHSAQNTESTEKRGSFILKKETEGTGILNSEQYEFIVTKDGNPAIGKMSIDGGEAVPIPEDGVITLKSGQSAKLTDLVIGKYTITERKPRSENYKTTRITVNGNTVEGSLSTEVDVVEDPILAGGWDTEDGALNKDENGYYTYIITKDQIDEDGNILVDCDLLAETMEAEMRENQNFTSSNFKVKFVNETGATIQYSDYGFDTVNWIGFGDTFLPSEDPAMLNSIVGYGWGEVWKPIYELLTGQKEKSDLFDAVGFDEKQIRTLIAPLRSINPAIVSFFQSNPGNGTLTGNASTDDAQHITLLQMNAFPELIKNAFTFKNYNGEEISLEENENRTYADFLCAFYDVQSLNELTVAQKYNVLGTGAKGSPGVNKPGQSHITTYYSNLAGTISNWCIPYADLDSGKLDYFKNYGFSETIVKEGNRLKMGGQIFTGEDADTYAYEEDYYLLESDPEVLKMAYEYLYERCIRLTLNSENRSISMGIDNSATSSASVGGIKDYLDKTEEANANVLSAMNNGAAIQNGESICLDKVKGYIEVPNAWNQFRYYDFGFHIMFRATEIKEETTIVFTNIYEEKKDKPSPKPSDKPKETIFTTDSCGNVFDEWGNQIYKVTSCNVGGYNLVRTSSKE